MSAFIAALPAFIAALPAFLGICVRMMDAVTRIVALAQQNEMSKWLESVENGMDQAEKAKTADEKYAAARNLASVLRGLG